VGNTTSAQLTGDFGDLYITVTAFDIDADGVDDQTDGNESWYSAEITPQPSLLFADGFESGDTTAWSSTNS
jgi:hypothetical protein